jgi:hypothetical protein
VRRHPDGGASRERDAEEVPFPGEDDDVAADVRGPDEAGLNSGCGRGEKRKKSGKESKGGESTVDQLAGHVGTIRPLAGKVRT